MVIAIFVIAVGCSKKINTSKFAGVWSGSYSSEIINISTSFDTGMLHITIDANNNNAIGTLQSLRGGATTMKGVIDPSSGTISMVKFGENNGITIFLEGLNGNLLVDAGSGALTFPWATASRWQATKN